MAPLGAGTAAAAPAASAELVIPGERYAAPDAGRIQLAGATGFLRGDGDSGLKWVPYSGGTVGSYANPDGNRLFGTGRDLIARLGNAQDRVDFTDVQGETTMTVAIPAGHRFATVMGTEVITEEIKDGAVVAVHALTVVDGVAKDRTVWGFPQGSTDIAVWDGDNAKGFLLSYRVDGVKKTAWIKGTNLGVWTLENVQDVSAKGDFLFTVSPERQLRVWGIDAPPGQGLLYQRDWPEGLAAPIGMVGKHVIARSAFDPDEATLTDYNADGGDGRTILSQVHGDTRITPNGRLLAVRFGTENARTVHSLRSEISGGALYADAIHNIPQVPTARHRIAVAQGELTSVDQVPWEQPRLRGTRLSVTDPITAEAPQDRGTGSDFGAHCALESDCPVPVPTGDGRVVYPNARQDLVLLDAGQQLPGATVVTGGVVDDVEASGRYVSFRSLNGTQKVFDLDSRKIVFDRGGFTGQATSLEGGTLWSEGATPGTVDAVDVRTGATLRSVKVADCHLKDLQVRRDAAYWKCDTASGVTDLGAKTTQPLPAHDTAVLGDGYVAHALDGTLSLTPTRGVDRATRTIGRPADARPGFGWAVDRFSGHLAWVDELQRTHVTPSGVPAPDVFVLDSVQPTERLDRRAAEPQKWSAKWWFSKPVRHWTLTFVDDTNTQSRTLHGWQVRGAAEVTWDGTDSTGQPMPDGVYRWTLDAEPEYEIGGPVLHLSGEVALTRLSSLASGRYQPVTPSRVMDTRSGTGVPKAKVGPGGTVSLQVTGRGGVPESSSVTAVVLNVTATNPTASTFVSAYPYGTTRTSASNLNVVAGQTVPNLVVVPVKDGKVTFYNRAGSLDLIADVAGYYWPGRTGSLYQPVTPSRVMDTRSGTGVPKAKVGADGTVSLQVTGRGGVPESSSVTAVVLNVTATNPTASTFVSAYPYGTTRTSASNLNVVAGQTVPNLVVVPVKDGKVTFYNRAGSLDLIADVAGYFTSETSGSLYEPVTPSRLMDTRSGTGVPKAKVGAGETVTLTVAGQGGVPATDVTAVVLNVTATNPTTSTFVSVYPYGTTRTSASNLNVVAGQTVPNLVVVPVKDGKVTFYNRAGSVDLIADVAGYFGS
ncbi:hypothetical protein ACH414_31955 [Streptomyces sp. NPDC020422]|uniref:hypothetical protein n=1 Tax=Streptomyces sp. NPDC020422 TaxID=3365074 RepID=UPI0037994D60